MITSQDMFEQQRDEERYFEDQDDLYEPFTDIATIENEMLQLLPSKENVEQSANRIITAVKENAIDPFPLLARMEAVKLFCEQVRKGVEDHTRGELEKYGKDGYRALDARFELAEVGTKYDYSTDTYWNNYKRQIEEIEGKMKEREKFLKALTKPIVETDMETGETVEVRPAQKTSKSSFKISLAK